MLCAHVWGEEAHELGVPMHWVCSSSLRQRWNVVCHVWGEEYHELGVWFLSDTKMECCVPLCGKAYELGVSFSLRWR
jgi:hypothetical protein